MKKGYFVTGTGTEVGKTVIMGGLLRRLALQGRGLAVKPVQTGCGRREDDPDVPDLEAWSRALKDCPRMPELFCPTRLRYPCSPHLAAELEGVAIDFEAMVDAVLQKRKMFDWLLVEGAGGLLVPLGGERTMLDLAGALGLPLLLVVDNRLGAVNHALLSILAVRNAGLPLAGVILNSTSPAGGELDRIIRCDNAKIIAALGGVDILADVPYIPDFSTHDLRCWEVCERALKEVL